MTTGVRIIVSDLTDPTHVVEDRTFARLPVRIGRNELNDMQLDHPFVSSFHVVLDQQDGKLILRDLGSTNGTLIGTGERIAPNTAVDAPAEGFAILALKFSVTRINSAEVKPVESNRRRAMAVSAMLTGPPVELMELLKQQEQARKAGATAADPTDTGRLGAPYAAYRGAWNDLLGTIRSQADALPEASRPQFYARISRDLPGLAGEPDFERMSGIARAQASGQGPSPEAIALEGLRELASDYGPRQAPPESAEDIVAFLTRLASILDVFMKCFVPLRDGYQQMAKELGVNSGRHTTAGVESSPRHGVEHANSAEELGHWLFDTTDREAEAIQTVEGIFADYMIHQVAMMNGVMNGVKSLLSELSPDAVDRFLRDPRHRRSIGLGPLRYKSLWQAYEQLHADFAGEEKHVFSLLFGRRFAEAYDESRGTHGSGRGTVPPPLRPSRGS